MFSKAFYFILSNINIKEIETNIIEFGSANNYTDVLKLYNSNMGPKQTLMFLQLTECIELNEKSAQQANSNNIDKTRQIHAELAQKLNEMVNKFKVLKKAYFVIEVCLYYTIKVKFIVSFYILFFFSIITSYKIPDLPTATTSKVSNE